MGKNAKRMREKALAEAAEADRPENRTHPTGSLLPPEFLKKIRALGLFIGDAPSFVSGHVATPSGYSVILPAKSGGNRAYNIECYYFDAKGDKAITYMPNLVIWGDGSCWHTNVHQYAPGPGPGDFKHTHSSLDGVYTDVRSYFFDASNVYFAAMLSAENARY